MTAETAEETPWTLIFAGTADIDESNLAALLDHWLPADLEVNPPVLPQKNAGTHPGLAKVHAYLTDQFGDDALEHVPSVADRLTQLEPGPDQYLVVLWGDGGDEETEKLVDQASRLGVTVLDLTDGLEEFTLGDAAPEPAPPVPPRKSRRRAGSAVTAAEQLSTPPEEAADDAAEETGAVTGLERIAAAILHRALTAALKELAELEHAPPPEEGTAASSAAPPPAAEEGGEVAQDSPRGRSNGTGGGATRRWVIDPATGQHLRLRGRPRNDRKDWEVVELTAAQEQELNLV